eukprot:12274008-Heterocapsa_arctica.AAC.1
MQEFRGRSPRPEGPQVRKTSARTSGSRIFTPKLSAVTSQGGRRQKGRLSRKMTRRRRRGVTPGEA